MQMQIQDGLSERAVGVIHTIRLFLCGASDVLEKCGVRIRRDVGEDAVKVLQVRIIEGGRKGHRCGGTIQLLRIGQGKAFFITS